MIRFDAFHLPGLDPADIADWVARDAPFGAVTWRVPVLRPGAIERLCARLRAARTATMQSGDPDDVIRAIDVVARRFADPADPLHGEALALLPAVTGYHTRMIEIILDRMAQDWRAGALHQTCTEELTDVAAARPGLLFHVFSGNVPGVDVTSLVRALLVGAASFGKSAHGQPVLATLFARALTQADARIGACIGVTWWAGGDVAPEAEAMRAADALVFYGGREAEAAIRERADGLRVIAHGPRISFGIAGGEALCDADTAHATATRVARATAMFDQQGCVSPHIVFAEDAPIGARAFAELVADAFTELERSLPRGRVTADEAAAIHAFRATAEFAGLRGADVQLFASQDTSHTVVYDADPTFRASPLHRTLRIAPIARAALVVPLVAPYRDVLQSAALEGVGPAALPLARALRAAGVTRITDFERLPWPAPWEPHDGRGPLRELLLPPG